MRIIIIFAFFVMFSVQAHAEKMRIAIMDFKADGVPQQEARRITELIRTEVINSGKFNVIERDQLDKILQEQGFQQTGCTDESCAVKIGKLASANKMLVGSVMMVAGTTVINGRIVDVEKGVAEFGERQVARSAAEIYDSVIAFSQKLTRKIYKDAAGIEYHSPLAAGLVSLAPFWSGSMNKGYDSIGMSLVLGKSLLLLCGILAHFEVWPVDAINKENYFVAFGAVTVGDMIYSSFAIAGFNEKYGLTASGEKKTGVSIAITPRIPQTGMPGTGANKSSGFNVSAVYRF